MKERLDKVFNEVKEMDKGVNTMLIPILQDTIADGNRHNKRMFIVSILALVVVAVVTVTSLFLIYKQNQKYQEFLSQFEFESTETVYQDTDDNSVINDGITINK